MSHEPTLSADRLEQRREHLMHEINTKTRPANEPVAGLIGTRRGRRGMRSALTGGLAVTAAAVACAIALSGPEPAGSMAFTMQRISHDTVAVKVVDSQIAADTMTAQLHRQGLNVTIDTYPVSPQLIGTWLNDSFSEDVPDTVRNTIIKQVPNGYTTTLDLPASFPGQIRLGVGRAPKPGEEPRVIAIRNALAPGGRLGCLHATDGDPTRVQSAAESLGYTVSWADGDQIDLAAIDGPAPGHRVVNAFISDAAPSQVQLVVATPGSTRYRARSHLGYAPSQWNTRYSNPAACTDA